MVFLRARVDADNQPNPHFFPHDPNNIMNACCRLLLGVFLFCLVTVNTLDAQAPNPQPPTLQAPFPVGMQRGTSLDLVLTWTRRKRRNREGKEEAKGDASEWHFCAYPVLPLLFMTITLFCQLLGRSP
jgi:hypothetical protein